jgi:hypothetical protein
MWCQDVLPPQAETTSIFSRSVKGIGLQADLYANPSPFRVEFRIPLGLAVREVLRHLPPDVFETEQHEVPPVFPLISRTECSSGLIYADGEQRNDRGSIPRYQAG